MCERNLVLEILVIFVSFCVFPVLAADFAPPAESPQETKFQEYIRRSLPHFSGFVDVMDVPGEDPRGATGTDLGVTPVSPVGLAY